MRSQKLWGFTLIELLTVITIIFILAGLVLSVSRYVTNKGKMSRAQTEIAAMSAACESYKADNGVYPDDGTYSGSYQAGAAALLYPTTMGNPTSTNYTSASLVIYRALSGDMNCNGKTEVVDGNYNLAGVSSGSTSTTAPTVYMSFKPTQIITTGSGTITTVKSLKDPWGYSYGYSTACAETGTNGYNPTFDLWSTTGATAPVTGNSFSQYQQTWITNW